MLYRFVLFPIKIQYLKKFWKFEDSFQPQINFPLIKKNTLNNNSMNSLKTKEKYIKIWNIKSIIFRRYFSKVNDWFTIYAKNFPSHHRLKFIICNLKRYLKYLTYFHIKNLNRRNVLFSRYVWIQNGSFPPGFLLLQKVEGIPGFRYFLWKYR